MGRMKEVWASERERRLLNGAFDRVIDPFDHDIAVTALCRIAAGETDARQIAHEALGRIIPKPEPVSSRTDLPLL
jgi:hypothetical protein